LSEVWEVIKETLKKVKIKFSSDPDIGHEVEAEIIHEEIKGKLTIKKLNEDETPRVSAEIGLMDPQEKKLLEEKDLDK